MTAVLDAPRRRGPRELPPDVAAGLAAGVYVSTTTAVALLGHGVTANRLSDWHRRAGVDVAVVCHPDGRPCQVPGRRGHENVWVWAQLHHAERQLRMSRKGRPRKGADTC
jgi:hypothetical protein